MKGYLFGLGAMLVGAADAVRDCFDSTEDPSL